MILHTARYSSQLPDRLDITRAGCDRLIAAGKPAPGEVLAPSHTILWPALRAIKAGVPNAFADYRVKYLAELRQRYRTRGTIYLRKQRRGNRARRCRALISVCR